MSERNRPPLPEWAEYERAGDLDWIAENMHIFLPAAKQGYEVHGRGAIVVDTTKRPTGQGHPFGYFTQAMLEEADEDTKRLIREYAPENDEVVAVLLKTQDRISSYRVKLQPRGPGKSVSQTGETSQPGSELAQKREPPDLETLIKWVTELGICETTHGCWAELDGQCEHGANSWLLELGLI